MLTMLAESGTARSVEEARKRALRIEALRRQEAQALVNRDFRAATWAARTRAFYAEGRVTM